MFRNKLRVLACTAAASLVVTTAQAQDHWSGGVWASNNYLDRGHSLSSDKPALQAALDYEIGHGVHAGTFTSTVSDGERYGQEIQLKLGVARETAGVEWDLYVNQHVYAADKALGAKDYFEVVLDLARPMGPVTAVAAFAGTPEDDRIKGYSFLGLRAEQALTKGLSLQSALGRMLYTRDAGEDYTFVSSGVAWAHASGFEVFLGGEMAGLDDELHPVIRLGRSI